MLTRLSINFRNGGIVVYAYYMMVFLSGLACLIYQVLWMRQLGLLFGNTSHAAAVTLAAFFAGLAAGNWFWGRRSGSTPRPLRTYAFLEAGIGLTAILYFFIRDLFYLVYPPIYQAVSSPALLLAVKGAAAVMLIFPPAFFMGGTIPIMGQCVIRRRDLFGTTAARLYGVNTLGAAIGAFVSSYVMVAFLGFRMTCIVAIAVTGGVAALAFRISRTTSLAEKTEGGSSATTGDKKSRRNRNRNKKPDGEQPAGLPHWIIYALALVSGFTVLSLEVLWTRLFAQMHENSVYSFSMVLVVVLVCLAAGALLASALARQATAPRAVLAALALADGICLSLFPFAVMVLTNDLQMFPTDASFIDYVVHVFYTGFITIALPCIALGMLFPFLMKSEERFAAIPGRSIGFLAAVNTIGAILGAMVCGFVFLELLGLWRTVQVIALLYLSIALLLPVGTVKAAYGIKLYAAVFLVLVLTVLSPADFPVTGKDPGADTAEVLEVWETGDCAVSVVNIPPDNIKIKVNSNYGLGSTGAMTSQVNQAKIPMMVFPRTRSIFFLGMGTGITAGGALDSRFTSVERVVACELVPAVVAAARKYMAGGNGGRDYTNGLFEDDRVEILVQDGRHHLMATDETFDMINADLFLPYRSGAGSLYSAEHFQSAKERLNPGGVFVQWLPLYQMTEQEFGTIARTMLSVFDQVTLWRNNFTFPGVSVALVGHREKDPLPALKMSHGAGPKQSVRGMEFYEMDRFAVPLNEHSILLYYCGNLGASKERFDRYPLNTDDRPVIEYRTPLSLYRQEGRMPQILVGPRLAELVDALLTTMPPSKDPVLQNRSAAEKRLPLAGAALYRVNVGIAMRDPATCRDSWDVFVREWSDDQP